MLSLDDLWVLWIVIAIGSLLFTFVVSILVYQIIWPPIIAYPWTEYNATDYENNANNDATTETTRVAQTVIFAASYNPPHLGHIEILKYLSKQYLKVIAVVGFNPDKKYLVSPEERACLLRDMVKSIKAKNIEVVVVEGYIWRYGKQKNINAKRFIRGIRSWEKNGNEERMLQMQNTWGPLLLGGVLPIKTIYLEGNPEFNHVSSTLIREICCSNKSDSNLKIKIESLSKLVPAESAKRVAQLYQRKE